MSTITDNVSREALLRYLDLQNAISDTVSKYQDLGLGVIANALIAKGFEVASCLNLPGQYQPPKDLP